MKIQRTVTLGFASFALLASVTAQAAEKKVSCASLPQAVQTAMHQEAAGAVVNGCVVDAERNRTTFEAETTKDGKSRDLTFNAEGKLLEVEQQVGKDEIPSAVATAIDAATAGGKVSKIESLSRDGQIVSYEASYRVGGKAREVAFTPDGKQKHG